MVFEILLSYRFLKDKIFPIILENITVFGWQRIEDSQNYDGSEFFLSLLRILLSKAREESVVITYSLSHFFISPPSIAKLFLSNSRSFKIIKCFSKCTFHFLILPECTF